MWWRNLNLSLDGDLACPIHLLASWWNSTPSPGDLATSFNITTIQTRIIHPTIDFDEPNYPNHTDPVWISDSIQLRASEFDWRRHCYLSARRGQLAGWLWAPPTEFEVSLTCDWSAPAASGTIRPACVHNQMDEMINYHSLTWLVLTHAHTHNAESITLTSTERHGPDRHGNNKEKTKQINTSSWFTCRDDK